MGLYRDESNARAIAADPEIYVFDDSFSALDLATDARLRAALGPYTRDAAVLVVAQRVSTIRDADQILVLEDGRVVGGAFEPSGLLVDAAGGAGLCEGFRAEDQVEPAELDGRRAAVLGGGGVARAVVAGLARVGVEHIDDLFEAIPASHLLDQALDLEPVRVRGHHAPGGQIVQGSAPGHGLFAAGIHGDIAADGGCIL